MLKKIILSIVIISTVLASQSNAHGSFSPISFDQAAVSVQDYMQAEFQQKANNTKPDLADLAVNTEDDGEVTIKISFAGDCTLGTDTSFAYTNSFPYQFEKHNKDYGYFFSGVKTVFEEDDLTLVNLETTLTTAEEKAEKKFRFKGEPSYVNILKTGKIEMVNISNNHIYDYLKQGFEDTVRNLKDAGIYYSGEGNTAYYKVKDIMIASIGYTGWDTSIKEKVCGDITEARKKADIVIVSFHWGEERTHTPNSTQTELGRLCIDNGADIVAGHHPHVIQGIENYKDKYILYSIGNFCFGGNQNPADKDTFIFQYILTLKDKKVKKNEGKIIPCSISSVSYINDYQPRIMGEDESKRVLDRIYTYSSKLKYGIKRD